MNEADKSRLHRALNRQSPQHPEARRILATATTRDLHPTKGSAAIHQAAASGAAVQTIARLNVTRANGTRGKRFCFGVVGFGWDQGEFEPGT